MIIEIVQLIVKPIFDLIDKALGNSAQAADLKAAIQKSAYENIARELDARKSIIVAELQGESWLQRNWRPLLMLWFAGLVGAHWLGFTPPNLSEATVQSLLTIVKIGVGGYILGRSGEKIVKSVAPYIAQPKPKPSYNQ